MNYASEIWGAEQLSKPRVIEGNGPAHQVLLHFLRRSFGVRKSTAHPVLLRESGQNHVSVTWLRQGLVFYNRVIKHTEVRIAMCADSKARAGTYELTGWLCKGCRLLVDLACALLHPVPLPPTHTGLVEGVVFLLEAPQLRRLCHAALDIVTNSRPGVAAAGGSTTSAITQLVQDEGTVASQLRACMDDICAVVGAAEEVDEHLDALDLSEDEDAR